MGSNFDFLNETFPVLAQFGKTAEKYLYSDANSCLMKLGMIGETIVNLMFTYDGIPLPQDNTAVKRIDTLYREGFLSKDIVDVLHALRKIRNKAVHENYASIADGKTLLQMAYSLCEWFMQTYGDWNYQNRPFVMPLDAPESVSTDKQSEQAQEEALIDAAAKAAATSPVVEKETRKKLSSKAASQRIKSEAETRYLIDEQLRKVGWDADTNEIRYSKGVRPAKGKNLAIAEWPTDSRKGNNGYADYALFIGEKMVGIIEAKKKHTNISSVLDGQCKEYARMIKAEHEKYVLKQYGEYKVPFLFATNGRDYIKQYEEMSGIWFLDTRQQFHTSKALAGWPSPQGMEQDLERDIAEADRKLAVTGYELLEDSNGLGLRYYQVEAVKAAEKAIAEHKNTVLLAMATGTGKTRTVLGMIYRFLSAKRFKRILYLVDRTALGEQTMDTFKDVKLENLKTLNQLYDIKNLGEKEFEKDTRVHIATVQSRTMTALLWMRHTEGIFWIRKWIKIRCCTVIRRIFAVSIGQLLIILMRLRLRLLLHLPFIQHKSLESRYIPMITRQP